MAPSAIRTRPASASRNEFDALSRYDVARFAQEVMIQSGPPM